MKLELKNITVNELLSDETHCYSASLYVDGKNIGTVSNRGHGGCDDFHGDREAYQRADDWCQNNLPATNLGNGLADVTTDLETWCAQRVTDHLICRDMKRTMERKALFTLPGKPGIFQLGYKGRRTPDPMLFTVIERQHPGAQILNTMPEADALSVFRSEWDAA